MSTLYERNQARLIKIGHDKCGCHQCLADNDVREPLRGWPITSAMMVVCPICGNKRCPHATDHRHACTDSNDVGQKGSIYGGHIIKKVDKDERKGTGRQALDSDESGGADAEDGRAGQASLED